MHSNTKLCCCAWSALREIFTYSKLQKNLTQCSCPPCQQCKTKCSRSGIQDLTPVGRKKNHNRQFQCARPVFKPSHRFTSTSAFPLNPFIERIIPAPALRGHFSLQAQTTGQGWAVCQSSCHTQTFHLYQHLTRLRNRQKIQKNLKLHFL